MGMTETLAGKRVLKSRVTLTKWGCSYADVSLDGEHTLAGSVELVMRDLTMQCAVLVGGPDKGRSAYRVVGGRGGLGKPLPPWSYSNDAGVKVATVLREAASLAGEELDTSTVPTTLRLGGNFSRDGDTTTSDLLERVAPAAWYVGEDGITRIGQRQRVELTEKVTIIERDRQRAKIVVASESLAKLVPGVVVDGMEAVDVEHESSAEKGVRTTLWGMRGSNDGSRGLSALKALVDHFVGARIRECRSYEYVVVKRNGKRLDVKPARSSSGMPPIKAVRMWPGIAGAYAELELGARVIVRFLENGEAVVTNFEDAEGEGFVPNKLVFADGGDLNGIVRQSDTLTCPAGAVAIVTASSKVKCG